MMKSLSAVTVGKIMISRAAYVVTDTPLNEIANVLLERRISAAPVLDEAM